MKKLLALLAVAIILIAPAALVSCSKGIESEGITQETVYIQVQGYNGTTLVDQSTIVTVK